MRWLKHMTAARQDEKIAALIDKAGLAGYGLWWMVLETVAAGMDKTSTKCSLKYPISKWAAELQLLPQNVCRQVAVLGAVGLLSIRKDKAGLELSIPNLLKYRDEYGSRVGRVSGDSPDQEQIQNTDTDTETEQIKPTPLSVVEKPALPAKGEVWDELAQKAFLKAIHWKGITTATEEQIAAIKDLKPDNLLEDDSLDSLFMLNYRFWWFEEFWEAYWNKASRKQARITFFKVVTDYTLHEIILKAIVAQTPQMSRRPRDKVPHASTWLNAARWEDPIVEQSGESEGLWAN